MKKGKNSFLSKLYDFWSPHIDQEEYLFYHRLLLASSKHHSKALELFCGSGRLLISYVKEGLNVCGIESSVELVKELEKKAKEKNVKVNVKQMHMENCEIKGEYGCIYVTLGSFQMLVDRDDGENLLYKAYHGLVDGGVLSIALFLPYVGGDFTSNQWVIASDWKDKETKHRYVRREKSTLYPVEQIIEGKVRYETWLGRYLLEMEERDLKMRWYGKYEFLSLLKEVGFKEIEIKRAYDDEHPNKESFMIFIARK